MTEDSVETCFGTRWVVSGNYNVAKCFNSSEKNLAAFHIDLCIVNNYGKTRFF